MDSHEIFPVTNLNYKTMKYKGATIEPAPTEKFPDMVCIIKATKKVKELVGKRFVDEHKAVGYIDAYLSEEFIERTKIKAYKDILRLGA